MIVIPAIPTNSNGINFRSRLEAKWAAMFDALGWPFVYEPELCLPRYIPDFLLRFNAGPIIVEVKPQATTDALRSFTTKIDASRWEGEAVIVGVAPDFGEDSFDVPLIGIIRDRDMGWDECGFFYCPVCGPTIHAESGSWSCRRCGELTMARPAEGIDQHWKRVCNRQQWQPGT